MSRMKGIKLSEEMIKRNKRDEVETDLLTTPVLIDSCLVVFDMLRVGV